MSQDNATTGVWVRVDPNGTSAQPENDHTVDGTQCFISPAGWFKPNRVIEVKDADGKSYKWLMGGLKRRGADFEVIEGQPTG